MNQNHKNVVIVLAKKPSLGKVKTRIAQDSSNLFAYTFSVASLEDLLNNLNNSNYYDFIVGTDTREDLEWFEQTYNICGIGIKLDPQTNLSERMKYIFHTLFTVYEYQKVILIPMDTPFIQMDEIISAFSRLDKIPYVLGPETNGGVYLIGINSKYFKKKLFNGIAWSSPHSFDNLINNLGLKNTYTLKYKDDINAFQDILINRDRIKLYCPKIFNLLQREGYYLKSSDRYIDFDTINICLPTVSAVIERDNNGQTEILLQTRNKPTIDPIYTGRFEIPSGFIHRYEDAYRAMEREVKEETGLDIAFDSHALEQSIFEADKNDSVLGYSPFYISQQTKGGRAYINLSFICSIKEVDSPLKENKYETKDPHWVTVNKLEQMLKDNPSQFFPLNIPILQKYIEYKKND